MKKKHLDVNESFLEGFCLRALCAAVIHSALCAFRWMYIETQTIFSGDRLQTKLIGWMESIGWNLLNGFLKGNSFAVSCAWSS
ncbi:hypothetical protein TNCV_4419661 [Trichonephila clavipes]|nr:hypothetical protein TNCV_4419661 [Trichonephila clavipes]